VITDYPPANPEAVGKTTDRAKKPAVVTAARQREVLDTAFMFA
jgi:hypothetical protein